MVTLSKSQEQVKKSFSINLDWVDSSAKKIQWKMRKTLVRAEKKSILVYAEKNSGCQVKFSWCQASKNLVHAKWFYRGCQPTHCVSSIRSKLMLSGCIIWKIMNLMDLRQVYLLDYVNQMELLLMS